MSRSSTYSLTLNRSKPVQREAAEPAVSARISQRPSRRQALRWSLGLAAVPALQAAPARGAAIQQLHWRETAMLALGTGMSLRLGHERAEVAEQALAAAVRAVQAVEEAMSLFHPSSQLVRLNGQGHLNYPSLALRQGLELALRVARMSEGAFDPSIQPLWRCCYEAHLRGRTPSPAQREAALRLLGFQGFSLETGRIALPRKGMALTLNGLAQGLAADAARQAVLQHGVQHALLDTGEWWPMGQAPEGSGWKLALAPIATAPQGAQQSPQGLQTHASKSHGAQRPTRLRPDGRAIACSTDQELQFAGAPGEHQILNPRTGHSPRSLALVAVAAPSAAWADALTKPLFMGTAQQALRLAARWKVDALVVEKSGHWQASPGFPIES